jgi:hypothetical protein
VASVRDYLTYIEREATARFEAGLDAWEAARDIAREIGDGAFAGLGERGRVSVNVETVYRTLDPAHEPANVIELFQRMAALDKG